MNVIKESITGTLESCDIQIIMEPGTNGIEINLQSSVEKQFGNHIKSLIYQLLVNEGIENASLLVIDKGALDCTIKARVLTAITRSTDSEYIFNCEEI